MKAFQLKNAVTALSRSQMKNIYAGMKPLPMADGGGGGGYSGKYMCCWTGSAICSACETHTAQATCISGATLTAC